MTTHIRTVDRFQFLKFDESEFKVRHLTPVSRVTSLFMGLSLLVIAIAMIYYPDDLTGFFLCAGMGLLVFFMAWQLEHMKRLQFSTEFVNAMMTSAVGRHWDFTLAVRRDGELIYLNRGFQLLFPGFIGEESLTIAAWLSGQQARMADIQRLMEALTTGEEFALPLTLQVAESGLGLHVTLQVEPIDRPSGYSLVRGKIHGPASTPLDDQIRAFDGISQSFRQE